MKTIITIIQTALIIGFIGLILYTGTQVAQVDISLFAGV